MSLNSNVIRKICNKHHFSFFDSLRKILAQINQSNIKYKASWCWDSSLILFSKICFLYFNFLKHITEHIPIAGSPNQSNMLQFYMRFISQITFLPLWFCRLTGSRTPPSRIIIGRRRAQRNTSHWNPDSTDTGSSRMKTKSGNVQTVISHFPTEWAFSDTCPFIPGSTNITARPAAKALPRNKPM